jgi:hypothetical protein
MTNSYYTPSTETRLTLARAGNQNTERAAVEAAFDKLPAPDRFKERNVFYAVGSGSASAQTATLATPAPTAYAAGMRVDLLPSATNTGGAMTLNLNGLGGKQILDITGATPAVGMIVASRPAELIYDGTAFRIIATPSVAVVSAGSVTLSALDSSVYASQAEAEAGSNNTKLMTALRTFQAIAASNTAAVISGNSSALSYTTGFIPAIQSNQTDGEGLGSSRFSADALSSVIATFKSRNASIGSHTIVQSGDQVLRLIGYGSDGTNGLPVAAINFEVDDTPGTNDMPGRIVFSTTNNGASALSQRWEIESKGHLIPITDGVHDIGSSSLGIRDLHISDIGTINFDNLAEGSLTGAATAAEQETGIAQDRFVSPGTQHRHPSACKVWGMTTGGGTPSLDGSYNMTSITDAGTGILTVTFATDFSGVTWGGSAIAASNTNNNRMCCLVTRAAGSVNLESSSATATLSDPAGGYAWAFFGDQA